jgi:DNA-binding SARP family transcriptional activator
VAATDFRILGELEVWSDGRLVDVTGARQRAVLAILLLHAGEVVSTDRILDDVWGDDPPTAGAAALRVRISQLRRALGAGGEQLATRAPGYVLRLAPDQLDLRRFERLVAVGEDALARGEPEAAAQALRAGLALWRGPPLADFADAPFAQPAIARLEELRVAATELRVEAELALGRHAGLVGELQALVGDHPLRERLCGQLMLALYRSGRQAEALEAYRAAHRRLLAEVGLEPGPHLQELEGRIRARDPGLAPDAQQPRPAPGQAVLALPAGDACLEALAGLAEPLAADRGHELLVAALVDDDAHLAPTAGRLQAVRAAASAHGVAVRVAAFTTRDRAGDIVRLAGEEDVALLLIEAPDELLGTGRPAPDIAQVLDAAACDVALVAGLERSTGSDGAAVLVPFGGHEHDWAAVELGAWFARSMGRPLRLVGTRANPYSGRRDASRLLGHASLALQRGLGVAAEPLLVAPGPDGVVAASRDAALLIAGLSDRWAQEGIGVARVRLARGAATPVLLVRRGQRPGGLAPARALTRFTWSAG